MATYGYGRVSKESSTSENQKMAIESALRMPLDFWYEDHAVSGSTTASSRKYFSQMISEVKAGDTVVFSRVDRVGRRTVDVLSTVEQLIARGVEVYILQIGKEPLNSPMGKVILGVFAIFAENERDSIVERTKLGLERTRKAGTVFGAKLKISPETLSELTMKRGVGISLDKLSAEYKLDRNTISQNVKKWGNDLVGYKAEWEKRSVQYERNYLKKSFV